MENKDFSKTPLVGQIYDELFDNIEKHDAFDVETIKTLKQLAAKGELKKSGKVAEGIKIMAPKENEITGTGN
jgi:hypothetical protein